MNINDAATYAQDPFLQVEANRTGFPHQFAPLANIDHTNGALGGGGDDIDMPAGVTEKGIDRHPVVLGWLLHHIDSAGWTQV